jgi:hypothetical protein
MSAAGKNLPDLIHKLAVTGIIAFTGYAILETSATGRTTIQGIKAKVAEREAEKALAEANNKTE